MAQNEYIINVTLNPVSQGTPVQSGSDAASGGGGTGDGQLPKAPGSGQEETAAAAKSAANAAKAIATQMASKVATTALNNYGNITGDYVTQQNMQTMVGEVTALGGAIAMGPVGVATYVGGKLIEGYNYVSQLKRSEAESSFKRQRVYAANNRS